MPKAEHPVEAFERDIISRATVFTAFLQLGPGARLKQEHPTREDAQAAAQEMADHHSRTVLVYGVAPEGRQALICTVQPQRNRTPPMEQATATASKAPKKAPAAAKAPTKVAAGARAKNRAAKALDKVREVTKKVADQPSAPRMRKTATEALEAAKKGTLPTAPDFTAETHKRFRPKLAELIALVAAKDIKGLKAYVINPITTSPKAMDRYRNLAVIALQAQASGGEIV